MHDGSAQSHAQLHMQAMMQQQQQEQQHAIAQQQQMAYAAFAHHLHSHPHPPPHSHPPPMLSAHPGSYSMAPFAGSPSFAMAGQGGSFAPSPLLHPAYPQPFPLYASHPTPFSYPPHSLHVHAHSGPFPGSIGANSQPPPSFSFTAPSSQPNSLLDQQHARMAAMAHVPSMPFGMSGSNSTLQPPPFPSAPLFHLGPHSSSLQPPPPPSLMQPLPPQSYSAAPVASPSLAHSLVFSSSLSSQHPPPPPTAATAPLAPSRVKIEPPPPLEPCAASASVKAEERSAVAALHSLTSLIQAAHDESDDNECKAPLREKRKGGSRIQLGEKRKAAKVSAEQAHPTRPNGSRMSGSNAAMKEEAEEEAYEQDEEEEDEDASLSSSSPSSFADDEEYGATPPPAASRSRASTTAASLLKRDELVCGSIRTAPGAKLHKFRSVIRCGAPDDKGGMQLTSYLSYFGRTMDVYVAVVDPLCRPLVRASTLADKFNCATNKIGMYLARRRAVLDGIYQAISFTDKPAGKSGLKVGGYFLTLDACADFERHFWEHREKKAMSEGEAQNVRQMRSASLDAVATADRSTSSTGASQSSKAAPATPATAAAALPPPSRRSLRDGRSVTSGSRSSSLSNDSSNRESSSCSKQAQSRASLHSIASASAAPASPAASAVVAPSAVSNAESAAVGSAEAEAEALAALATPRPAAAATTHRQHREKKSQSKEKEEEKEQQQVQQTTSEETGARSSSNASIAIDSSSSSSSSHRSSGVVAPASSPSSSQSPPLSSTGASHSVSISASAPPASPPSSVIISSTSTALHIPVHLSAVTWRPEEVMFKATDAHTMSESKQADSSDKDKNKDTNEKNEPRKIPLLPAVPVPASTSSSPPSSPCPSSPSSPTLSPSAAGVMPPAKSDVSRYVPQSPPSSSVSNALALIRSTLDEEARKRTHTDNGQRTHNQPPVFAFLRQAPASAANLPPAA